MVSLRNCNSWLVGALLGWLATLEEFWWFNEWLTSWHMLWDALLDLIMALHNVNIIGFIYKIVDIRYDA